MSLRRFNVLLRNLSGDSATVAHVRAETVVAPDGRRERVVTVTGPKATEQAFESMFRK